MTQPKNLGGRPSVYTLDLANEICDSIASCTRGLATLCRQNPHWPDYRTVRDWIRNNPGFSHLYALAKEDQSDLMADEILEIADDASHDTIMKYNKDGSEYESCNTEWVNRSRLRVDARKWIAAKLKPKIYGDVQKINFKGSIHEDNIKDLE